MPNSPARGLARARARLDVLRHVAVQRLEVLPALGVAVLLQQRGDLQIARARRDRVGHDDLALVLGIGQFLPTGGHRQVLGLEHFRVDAERGHVAGGGKPLAVGGAVAGVEFVAALGGVGLEQRAHARVEHVGHGPAPDHVVARVAGLGQDARAQVASRQAQHLDVQVGQVLLGGGHVVLDLVLFKGRVDRDRAGVGDGGTSGQRGHDPAQAGGVAEVKTAGHNEPHSSAGNGAPGGHQFGSWGDPGLCIKVCLRLFEQMH
ncbi:MAG: hypothetical protein GAK30_02453 [Paracidovorax wautersii]|uniref:Uncharacterized protein n=1 Tax=Paracidovorax wautersii TaxID=1177982 RepID=A0A7V8FMZ9_9BURK|nr:MAG: hypothetical protein GAK30_02453 [Paracidovorax wautersii]